MDAVEGRPVRGRAARPRPPPLFDWPALADWARFVLRSFGRHRWLGVTVIVTTLVVTGLVVAFAPRRYSASTKLLARPTTAMAALANPNVPIWDEAPTRAARERVLAHDSIEKIAAETDLVVQWRLRRNPVLKMKDQLQQLLGGAWTDDVWSDIVVGTLEQRLRVGADEQTVEISVEWPDPDLARRIVESATRNFIETRHVRQIEAINEAISILELHATQTQESVDGALENLRRVLYERSRGDSRVLARAAAKRNARPRAVTSQELAQLEFTLRAKQAAVAELEEQRRRALDQAKATLQQQAVLYNRASPALRELERKVRELERDSPQLAQLKRDVHELETDFEEKGGKPGKAIAVTPAPPAQSTGLVSEASLANLPPELERDPAVSVAQEQVRVTLGRYQELLMRVESARLALDTARAAFKHRFQTLRPAQTPKTALSPNVPATLAAGLLFAIVLAFFATAGLDLFKRTLCEPWQIRRQLKLPVLVELKEPPK